MLFNLTKMKGSFLLLLLSAVAETVSAGCPYMVGGDSHSKLVRREDTSAPRLPGDDGFLDQFVVDDSDVFTTTDFGTRVADRTSLKAGQRGPTLLEDFVLRTKITRFDHERVPERAGELNPCSDSGRASWFGSKNDDR